ncbi:MAG: hypothetical protein ACFB2Z_01995 [Maricaulaceae bacterium]
MSRIAFGLDFGASKTALAALIGGPPGFAVEDLPLSRTGSPDRPDPRVSSCLLVPADGGTALVGQTAELEQRLHGGAEGRFVANFKPRLPTDAQARADSVTFLKALAQEPEPSARFRAAGDRALVIAGAPAAWDEAAQGLLRGVLGEAGFPETVCVPEPLGAAFNFFAGKISAEDLAKPIIVVDWGAGTFDMTRLAPGEMDATSHFGSPIYGGRLFDDLFFQWIMEGARKRRSGEAQKVAQDPLARRFLHAVIARRIKEEFSLWIDRPQPIWPFETASPVRIGAGARKRTLGDLEIRSFEAFEARARAYRPSDLTLEALDLADVSLGEIDAPRARALAAGEPVDLLAWGEALLCAGLEGFDADAQTVLALTGGSTNWRWFREAVQAGPAFQGREGAVLFDGAPELTIARGLARAYGVSALARTLSERFKPARAGFERVAMRDVHYPLITQLAEDCVAALIADLDSAFTEILTEAELDAGAGTERARAQIAEAIADWARTPEARAFLDARSDGFAAAARAPLAEALQTVDPQFDGVLALALEACAPPEAPVVQAALSEALAEVRLEPDVLSRLMAGLMSLWGTARDWMSLETSPLALAERAAQRPRSRARVQAQARHDRLTSALAGAIAKRLRAAQRPPAWSARAADRVSDALTALMRVVPEPGD